MFRLTLAVFAILIGLMSPAMAWWDMGHMEVAAIAYGRLKPATKTKVDALIKLHPAYGMWTKGLQGLPDDEIAQQAFVRAATWADDIKGELNCKTLHTPDCYKSAGDDVGNADAGQNIGTSDHLAHAYWHFYDIPFSPDGTPTVSSPPVNALSEIKLLTTALTDTSATDDLKCYDLVWLLHLVGDAHQPLHAVGRFTKLIDKGDRGGNDEMVNVGEIAPITLHAFWDSLLGDSASPSAAIAAASLLPPADPMLATRSDPESWFQEGAALAQTYAYGSVIGNGPGPYQLSLDYEKAAKSLAQSQVALAGMRLGNLINTALH